MPVNTFACDGAFRHINSALLYLMGLFLIGYMKVRHSLLYHELLVILHMYTGHVRRHSPFVGIE